MKIFERLGWVLKFNYVWCILMDMLKKGVGWDEDMFVVMIDSYG